MKLYTIKPLEWRKAIRQHKKSPIRYEAKIRALMITLECSRQWSTKSDSPMPGWWFSAFIGEHAVECEAHETLKSAQAAAEAWHRERIEAALILQGE